MKIELPRLVEVVDSYFTGQYSPPRIELPCYPPRPGGSSNLYEKSLILQILCL